MSGLTDEQRADFMRHTMTRGTVTRGPVNQHYRACAECGVRLPWDGWEKAMQLHLRDLADDYVRDLADDYVTAALNDAADHLARLGAEVSRYDDDPETVMAWRTYEDAARIVRARAT